MRLRPLLRVLGFNPRDLIKSVKLRELDSRAESTLSLVELARIL
jgi:hypothetical protein